MKNRNRKVRSDNSRIRKLLYPIILLILLVVLAIYGQSIVSQWNVLTRDYDKNKDIVKEMSTNIAGNINLATRMFETRIIEDSEDVYAAIIDFYETYSGNLEDVNIGSFLTQTQDLWLDVSIFDSNFVMVNEKETVGTDSYKLSDISGARKFADELIAKDSLRGQWITISSQTDVIIKYIYRKTADEKYTIELASNLVNFNKNIDVYDMETFANDLASNFDFVKSAYVFNTEGISTSNLINGNPDIIQENLKGVFEKAIETMSPAESTESNRLGYSETLWAIPINVSMEGDENVYYNYAMVLSFNNHETMNFFYAQASVNLLISLLTIIIIILLNIRNSRQYLIPLSSLTQSIQTASEGDYNNGVKISGAPSMKKTIREYNGLLSKIKEAIEKRENAYFQTINALVNAIDASDKYTAGHCTRVMELSLLLGEKLNLSSSDMKILRYGALLHDIGKIGIDTSIVNKAGKLTETEYIKIKTHPSVGLSIISNIEYLNKAKCILDEHHEKWNGKGYPNGLKGDEIHYLSRIVTITDAYDAMASKRSYRNALNKENILNELLSNTGSQFDPDMIPVFVKILEENKEDIETRIYKDVVTN